MNVCGKIVAALITFISISLVLVGCVVEPQDSEEETSIGQSENEEAAENLSSETSEPTDSDPDEEDVENATESSSSVKIKEITDCDVVTVSLGDFARNYELEDSHFDKKGYSCFYAPFNKVNEKTGEEAGYITVIGRYSASMFETKEELEEHGIYDVFDDKRVESFGGVAYGLNEHNGNDVVTQISTPDFELSLNVTSDRIDVMYGEPSIDVLLELIEN